MFNYSELDLVLKYNNKLVCDKYQLKWNDESPVSKTNNPSPTTSTNNPPPDTIPKTLTNKNVVFDHICTGVASGSSISEQLDNLKVVSYDSFLEFVASDPMLEATIKKYESHRRSKLLDELNRLVRLSKNAKKVELDDLKAKIGLIKVSLDIMERENGDGDSDKGFSIEFFKPESCLVGSDSGWGLPKIEDIRDFFDKNDKSGLSVFYKEVLTEELEDLDLDV